jgi:hypothetical protein
LDWRFAGQVRRDLYFLESLLSIQTVVIMLLGITVDMRVLRVFQIVFVF